MKKIWIAMGAMLMAFSLLLAGCGGGGASTETKDESAPEAPAAQEEAKGLTKAELEAKYEEVQLGMTYEEAVEVIGQEGVHQTGDEFKSSDMYPNSKVYSWYPSDDPEKSVLTMGFKQESDGGGAYSKSKS